MTDYNWNQLNHANRLRLVLEAQDIIVFSESPWFLNIRKPDGSPGLWPKERFILSLFSERDSMGIRKYNELWLGAGMRSSKTYQGSLINTHEAFKLIELGDPASHYGLAEGEEIFLINVATNEKQALDTVFAKTRARINHSPYFQTYVKYGE